jgi:hypothetical protein
MLLDQLGEIIEPRSYELELVSIPDFFPHILTYGQSKKSKPDHYPEISH